MTTDNEKPSLSFGRYLQSIRIEKGIKLEDVTKETRIRPDTLIHIEEENHEQLPDIVFVKGFLRAYAKAIGADGDEAVRRYISRLEVINRIDTTEVDLKRSNGVFWRRFLLSIGALICLIAVTLYMVSMWRDRQLQTEETPEITSGAVPVESATNEPIKVSDRQDLDQTGPVASETLPKENEPATAESASEISKENEGIEPPIAPETDSTTQALISGYLLKINTIEETWMKIGIDNQEPKEYNLFPGDQIELEATDSYTLRIGNAGGINISLNGKRVELPQKSGQVVTIKLP